MLMNGRRIIQWFRRAHGHTLYDADQQLFKGERAKWVNETLDLTRGRHYGPAL